MLSDDQFIKGCDFEKHVFGLPVENQAEKYSQILISSFDQFVPKKTVFLKPHSIPWCNTYTRLLLRKKNRNYKFFKKLSEKYLTSLKNPNIPQEICTQLLTKKVKARTNFKTASKESLKANQRAKNRFFNSVNSTMLNFSISAKKKFSILTKLMNNQKFSSVASLVEGGNTVDDPLQKSNILNNHFASKSTVHGSDDDVPILPLKDNVPLFDSINTSPLETAKIIRALKQSCASYCGIPGKFISLLSTQISFSLSKLFNNLFKEGVFPDIWKISHITALYKHKGLKSDKNNYRPICLLPTFYICCLFV